MWVSQAEPAVDGANLWFVIATTVTTLGSIVTALVSHRRAKTAQSEAAAAADEAVDQYKRMIADPLKRDRDRYQHLWQECMEGHRERRRDQSTGGTTARGTAGSAHGDP